MKNPFLTLIGVIAATLLALGVFVGFLSDGKSTVLFTAGLLVLLLGITVKAVTSQSEKAQR